MMLASSQEMRPTERKPDRSLLRKLVGRMKDESVQFTDPSRSPRVKSVAGQNLTSSSSRLSKPIDGNTNIGALSKDYWQLAGMKLEAERPDIYRELENFATQYCTRC
jgi:hypothetical protein